MRATHILAAAAALLTPSMAFAFPIAVGAAGVGLLGILALPLLLACAGAYWVLLNKGRGIAPLLALLIVTAVSLLVMKDYGQEQGLKAALFTKADTSYLNRSIPFPFMDASAQAASSQAVTAAEFVDGLLAGHFKALKISTYPSLFAESGQVSVEEIWRDKDLLIDEVERLGGRVVLVDQYGGIAGSVASAALTNFGLSVGFLQGGSTALSKYGWKMADESGALDEGAVAVSEYRNWIAEHPSAFVLGITTDREFVEDGWMFGNRTLTLEDFVANYDSLLARIGREVFVAGFETNDSGATPVVVQLLRAAGIEVHFVMPEVDEILIKPAYYDAYRNDERAVTVDDAKRYMRQHKDVEFLDFSERPWPVGLEFMGDRYHHLPMARVARGELPAFVHGLDPSKVYVGLAFDRRTAYHALLAGELLSKRGVAWLGRFTQASSLTEPYLSVEELNTAQEALAFWLRTTAAEVGKALLGSGLVLAALAGLLSGVPLMIMPTGQLLRMVALAVTGVLYACIIQARGDNPQLETTYVIFWVFSAAANALALCAIWGRRRPIRPLSNFSTELPPKAGYLNLAAIRGHRVAPGFVVSRQDTAGLIRQKLGRGRYIVRSATAAEAADHESTAGLYASFQGDRDDVEGLIERVLQLYSDAGVVGSVLVQRYVKADWYGVIQLQDNDKSHMVICEVGGAEAVTSGDSGIERFEFPIWDVAKQPRHVRAAARALLDLMRVGAFGIEFAVSRGSLTVLQVNHSETRACAEMRLASVARSKVIEVSSSHPDPLSAAIVAALSPGQILAYGNRRFCMVEQAWRAKMNMRSDLRKLGFHPSTTDAEHLVAWVDSYTQKLALLDPVKDDPRSVVDALKRAAGEVGRLNRIATTMLAMGRAGEWKGDSRPLPSSQAGSLWADGAVVEWAGMPIAPLVGFDASAKAWNFTAEEFSSTPLEAETPIAWVKDATSILLAANLAAISRAIGQLIDAGASQQLLHCLDTQIGYWDAFADTGRPTQADQPAQIFASVMLGTTSHTAGWRIPSQGITGTIATPDQAGAGNILLLDRCSMDYLPLLSGAKAVLARQGSVTSHLMQHAAAKNLPVIISGFLPEGLRAGDQVRIDAQEGVSRA